jgi:P27 family predicted phage terminase small subunit
MAKTLETIGVLTQVDKAAFAGYCQAYARWKEAEEFLSKHGTIFKTPSGYIQQVPQVSIAQTYLKVMKDFCSEFGLTPAARTRIQVDSAVGQEDDPMESILKVMK